MKSNPQRMRLQVEYAPEKQSGTSNTSRAQPTFTMTKSE